MRSEKPGRLLKDFHMPSMRTEMFLVETLRIETMRNSTMGCSGFSELSGRNGYGLVRLCLTRLSRCLSCDGKARIPMIDECSISVLRNRPSLYACRGSPKALSCIRMA